MLLGGKPAFDGLFLLHYLTQDACKLWRVYPNNLLHLERTLLQFVHGIVLYQDVSVCQYNRQRCYYVQ